MMNKNHKIFFYIILALSILISPHLIAKPKVVADSKKSNSSVDNFTGSTNVSIPIKTPSGRMGIEPSLGFSYNNGGKNGWLGFGWDIPMSTIAHSTKFGLDYNKKKFVVMASPGGGSELFFEKKVGMNEYYQPKIENGFTKYQFNPHTGWLLTSTSGVKYFYGSRSSTPSKLSTSTDTFKWYLDKVLDIHGNYMEINYLKNQGYIYLSDIHYTGNEKTNTPCPYKVTFYYEDRPDELTSFRGLVEQRIAKRLKTIDISFNNDRVRAYKVRYLKNRNLPANQSFISKIEEYGNDAVFDTTNDIIGGESLPAYAFKWGLGGDKTFTLKAYSPSVGYPISKSSQYTGDFNGDGKTDIIHPMENSNYANIWMSNGDGTFKVKPFKVGYKLEDGRWATGDFNGDGLTDLIHWVKRTDYADIWISKGDGTFKVDSFRPWWSYPNGKGVFHPGDYNGDGLTDFTHVLSNGEFAYIWLALGNGKFKVQTFNSGAQYNKTIGNWYSGDFNGDGLTDLIDPVENAKYAYIWLANGDGSFSIKTFSPQNNIDFNDTTFAPGDFNGDGFIDLANFVNNTNYAYIWISQGDGTFRTEAFMPSAGYQISSGTFMSTDFNGDGLTDLVHFIKNSNYVYIWQAIGDGTFTVTSYSPSVGYKVSDGRFVVGDFNGDTRQDLIHLIKSADYTETWLTKGNQPLVLTQMSRSPHTGLTTTFDYTTLAEVKDKKLPFNSHIIKKVTNSDSVTGITSATEYSYEGGLYDHPTREFRGFKNVQQINQDGTVAISTFHQTEYLKGRQEKTITKESINGPKISEETFTWGQTNLTGKSKFIHLLTKNSKVYENNAITVETQTDNTYTEKTGTGFWFMQSSTSKSISHPSDESITQKTDIENFGEWLWRPTSESVTGSKSGKVRETISAYENETGNLLKKEVINTTGANSTVQYAYDSYGNVLKEWDANHSNTATDPYTEYIYDTATQTYPVKVINPLGHTAESTYDYRYGAEKTVTDPNGHVITNHFDPFGRVIQTDAPDGGQTLVEYKDDVIPTWVRTRQKVSATEYIESYEYFDGLGRSIQAATKSAPSGAGVDQYVVSKTFYDEMGRSYYAVGPFLASGSEYLNWNAKPVPVTDLPYSLTTFDIRGRAKKTVSPDNGNREIISLFDYNGLSTTVTDPDRHKKTEVKDTLGRTVKVIEHGPTEDAITRYEYNAAGDLTIVKNALWSPTNDNQKTKTEVFYNTLGQKKRMIDPDMGAWSYEYDPNGNMVSQTDNKKQTTTFEYDVLNRLKKKTYPAGVDPAAVIYLYDDTQKTQNAIGKLCVESNTKVTTTTNAYDVMGRALSITKDIAGGGAKTTESIYDIAGRVQSVVYPNTGPKDYYRADTFFYPGTSLVDEVKDDKGARVAKFSEYNAAGKIGKIEHGNGIVTEHIYDDHSLRLVAISTKDGAGNLIQNKEYTYSAAGDIESINDRAKFVTHSYTYDHLHRLETETSTGVETFKAMVLDFVYDDANLNTPLHAPKAVTQNGVAHAFTYDANGNMTDGWDLADPKNVVKRTISDYTPENMPGKVVYGADTISLTYDGAGKRSVKTSPTGSTHYYFEHYEKKKNTDHNYVFAGNLRVAMVKQNAAINERSVVHFHKDHLGSTNVTTDHLGKVQQSSTFLPYGGTREESGITDSGYMFTDQEKDVEFGLYNYDARLYDPVMGLFVSADSIVPDWYDPQSLNRFAYCRNNPLLYVDPSGHEYESWAEFENRCLWGMHDLMWTPFYLLELPDQALDYVTKTSFEERMHSVSATGFPIDDAIVLGLRGLRQTVRGLRGLSNSNELKSFLSSQKGSLTFGSKSIPYGFSSLDDFSEFNKAVNKGLGKAGYKDATASLQGSAVTGRGHSSKKAFGLHSDFDIAISSESLFKKATKLGLEIGKNPSRIGPLTAKEIKNLGLSKFHRKLEKQAGGREVNFMLFKNQNKVLSWSADTIILK